MDFDGSALSLQLNLVGVELLQGLETPDQYSTEATFEVGVHGGNVRVQDVLFIVLRFHAQAQLQRRVTMLLPSERRALVQQNQGATGFDHASGDWFERRSLKGRWRGFAACKRRWAATR